MELRALPALVGLLRSLRALTMAVLGALLLSAATLHLVSPLLFGVSTHVEGMPAPAASAACSGSCVPMSSRLLDEAVSLQEEAGLTCTAKRSEAAIVLLQYSADQSVRALSPERAEAAVERGLGRVQRYCGG